MYRSLPMASPLFVALTLATFTAGCSEKRNAAPDDGPGQPAPSAAAAPDEAAIERPERPATPGLPGPREVDPGFVVARPEVVEMAVPARFDGGFPTREQDLTELDSLRPRADVMARLAAGDATTRTRFAAGAEAAGAGGHLPRALKGWYVGRLGYTPSAATCAWLKGLAADEERPSAREVALEALTRCNDPTLAPLYDGARDAVFLDWAQSLRGDAELPWLPRLAKVVHATAVDVSTNDYQLRQLGFLLARVEGPDGVTAVEAIQEELKDPRRAALIGIGMLRAKTPSGRRLGEKSCEQLPDEALCRHRESRRAPDAETGLTATGAGTSASAPQLSACVRSKAAEYKRRSCLAALTEVDRSAAVHAARDVLKGARERDPSAWSLTTLARQLVAYPEAGALEARLDALGLTANARALPDEDLEPALDVPSLLVARGRAHWFDVETGQYPNEHDALLYALAAIASPALDEARFEEIAPSAEPTDEAPYLLHAYLGGKRYSVAAENLGDWYDVEAVLGLLNALLIAEGSDVRFTNTPTGDQTAIVIAAPKRAFAALIADGLLERGRPGQGMEDGKAFEQRVLESLQTP